MTVSFTISGEFCYLSLAEITLLWTHLYSSSHTRFSIHSQTARPVRLNLRQCYCSISCKRETTVQWLPTVTEDDLTTLYVIKSMLLSRNSNHIYVIKSQLLPRNSNTCMWMTSEFINPANYSRWLWLLWGFSLFSVSSTVSNRLSSRRLELEAAVHTELKISENDKIHVTLLSWLESMVVILSYKVTILELGGSSQIIIY